MRQQRKRNAHATREKTAGAKTDFNFAGSVIFSNATLIARGDENDALPGPQRVMKRFGDVIEWIFW
jgi:hypothetical protein